MPRRGSLYRPDTLLAAEVARERGALTQAEAAQAAGLTQRTWSAVERSVHRPSADTALKLARWLGWTVEEVLEAADRPVADDASSG